MKKYKILILIFLIIFVVAGSGNSFAQDSTTSATSASKLTTAEQTLKDKTILEINRRLTTLDNLEKRIKDTKKLSDANKNNLVLQVADQVTSLNNLKTKIQADTDMASIRADRLNVTAEYRIYLLFIPKMQILVTSDRIMEITSDMDSLLTRIQPRVDQLKQKGTDVNILQTTINDIKTKIGDAYTQAKAASDEVTPLTPDNGDQAKFTANKNALVDARKKLVTARQDLSGALQDFAVIRSQLNPETKISSPSASSATNSALKRK